MSLTNAAETAMLNLLFNNVAWANIGDASGIQPSAVAGSFYISLHTADPGESGDQSTNECTYTPYARVAVARTSAGFTVAGNVADNFGIISFAAATAGVETATHYGIGTDASGTGNLIWFGALARALDIYLGVQPQFPAGNFDTSVD